MEIHSCFKNVVGQKAILSALSRSLFVAEKEKDQGIFKLPKISPLLTAVAGLGKTEIATAYAKAMSKILDGKFIHFPNASSLRKKGEDFNKFLDTVTDDQPYVIYLDEIHELKTGQGATVQEQTLLRFLRSAMDTQNIGKIINIDEDHSILFKSGEQVIILATNHADKIDSALRSRMQNFNLLPYTKKETEEITTRLLGEFQFNYEVYNDGKLEIVPLIAECGRGSIRPIKEMLRNQLCSHMALKDSDNNLVTREDVFNVLKSAGFYPKGITHPEIQVIRKTIGKPLSMSSLLAIVTELETCQKQAISFLLGNGWIDKDGTLFNATKKGTLFLKRLCDLGFLEIGELKETKE